MNVQSAVNEVVEQCLPQTIIQRAVKVAIHLISFPFMLKVSKWHLNAIDVFH